MQIRTSLVTRNGKTYEYAQLVESYRRESDGVPSHRVVAHLGALSALEMDNWRTVLAAGRQGKRVVMARSVARAAAAAKPRIEANLRYLDVAVLLQLWRRWKLDELLGELLPRGEATVPAAAMVAALAIQRCVDPGSKLFATQWFPRSALPELLGIAPAAFNNTRVHRVLDDLDGASRALMARLPALYQSREGAFASLFLDVTDTWFVGHGPTMAALGKTKEGMVRRKIGVVLLCNEHGYPLRWEVVRGTAHDSTTMTSMVQSIAKLPWAQGVPMVCDRAMGRTAQIRDLSASGLAFMTALTVSEFDSYTDQIPHQAVADIAGPPTQPEKDLEIKRAAQQAQQAGMARVEDTLFVLDLGVVAHREPVPAMAKAQSSHESLATVMALVRELHDGVQSRQFPSYGAAGRARGLGRGVTFKYASLRTLAEPVQRLVLDGKANDRSLAELLAIAGLVGADEQLQALDRLLSRPVRNKNRSRSRAATQGEMAEQAEPADEAQEAAKPLRLRLVVYFNPQMCVDQRARAHQRLREVDAFVEDLNTALAAPRSRQKREGIAAAVDRKLRGQDLLDVFDLHIREVEVAGRPRFTVELKRKPDAWQRRRRYDGFTVLAIHPSIQESAARLGRLYREKDVVEKDFQSIKSIVELRPVWHHTDAKVRAHVTLCMLSLLLEKTLARQLSGKLTAEAALQQFAPCHLNRYRLPADAPPSYILTDVDGAQKAILRTLRMEDLVIDDEVTARLMPR